MTPGFDLQGGVALALARAAPAAGELWVFGALMFRVMVMPRVLAALPEPDRRRLGRRLLIAVRAGVALGLAGTLGWLVAQAGWIVGGSDGASGLGAAVLAAPVVAAQTRFGRLLVLQAAALAGVAVAVGRRDRAGRARLGLGFAALALGLQAGHGHAAAMAPGSLALLGWDLLHLAGAGGWLGGLPPLLLVVEGCPAAAAAMAARGFSGVGRLCVAAVVVSAIGQSWTLAGGVPGLVGTGYGWMLLVKAALLAVLLGFAWVNRYRLAPALLGADAAGARRRLVRSIAVQSGFGVAAVVAAAVLSNLPPAMHVQPVWPFGVRFSLDAVREDAGLRDEVLAAAAAAMAGVAAVLAAVAAAARRGRTGGRRAGWGLAGWGLGIGGVAMLGAALPHLGLLVVPASPVSFYRSPTGMAARSIAAGAALYPVHCAACHGPQGRGDGVASGGLGVAAADLTAAHVWMHEDGELFWWLLRGIRAPDGRLAMPGFEGVLSDAQRWALIDLVRARNAGLAYRARGRWPAPVAAPELRAVCAGGRRVAMADLRGGFVRVVIGPAAAAAGVTTIVLGVGVTAPGPGLCVVEGDADGAEVAGYAIVGGLEGEALSGAEFLVDRAGWLRAVRMGGWDARGLAAALAGLDAAPVRGAAMEGHRM